MNITEENTALNNHEFEGRAVELRSRPSFISIPNYYSTCNASCLFCWQFNPSRSKGNNRNDISLATFPDQERELIDQEILPFARTINWCVPMEILLDRKAVEIILQQNQRKRYAFATNGSMLPAYLDRFIESENEFYIRISLNASNAKRHQQITGLDNFEDIVQAIRKYAIEIKKRNLKVRLGASTVIFKSNIEDMVPFFKLCESLDIHLVDYIFLVEGPSWSFHMGKRSFNYYRELPSWEHEKLTATVKRVEELSRKSTIKMNVSFGTPPDLSKITLANIFKKMYIHTVGVLYYLWSKYPRLGNLAYELSFRGMGLYNDFRLLFMSRAPMATPCEYPWKNLIVHPNGRTRCCPINLIDLGKIHKGDAIDRIWNGWRLRRIRKLMRNGYLPGNCKNAACPFGDPLAEKYAASRLEEPWQDR